MIQFQVAVIEAMKAENDYRRSRGNSQAYGEKAFLGCANDIKSLADQIETEVDAEETGLPEMIEALKAVRDFGGKGETEDGTSVSWLVEVALRKAGES